MALIDWDYYDRGEVQVGRDGVGQIRDKLRARMSSRSDSLTALRAGLAQLQRWQPHPTEPGFMVDQFQGTQQSSGFYWDCTVTYTDDKPKDPLQIPAVIGEVKSFKMDGATILEWDNKPILNTAGEPVEPLSKPEQIVVYAIKRNIPDLQDWLFNFESCINADVVRLGSFSCDPKTLMINSIGISEENESGDTKYRTATIEVWRRKSKWLEYFPSRGYHEIADIPSPFINKDSQKPDTTKKGLRPILIAGATPDRPQFLDKDGKWLGANPSPDQIVMLTKQLYPAVPFGPFPLK